MTHFLHFETIDAARSSDPPVCSSDFPQLSKLYMTHSDLDFLALLDLDGYFSFLMVYLSPPLLADVRSLGSLLKTHSRSLLSLLFPLGVKLCTNV